MYYCHVLIDPWIRIVYIAHLFPTCSHNARHAFLNRVDFTNKYITKEHMGDILHKNSNNALNLWKKFHIYYLSWHYNDIKMIWYYLHFIDKNTEP